jgi:NDP-sugar pyrophosphorylase family protein
MFRPTDLLDLTQCPCPGLFDGCHHAWDVLDRIGDHIATHIRTGNRGTVLGSPYIADDVEIGEGTVIEHGAVIKGPAVIGAHCEIRCGAYIRGNVIVGNHCVLGNASEFKNAVLFHNVQVPHFSYVGDSILGYKAHLGAGVILSNVKSIKGTVTVKHDGESIETGLRKFGAIIGDGAAIGCNCVLNPGSIIGRRSIFYPNIAWRGVCPPDSIVKLRQEQVLVVRNERGV